MEPNPLFVVLIGIGIVFIGLICIVLLCNIMNTLYDMYELQTKNKSPEKAKATPAETATAPVKVTEIPNRQELIAAVSAAIAEEEGKELSAIRILSIKPL